MSQAASHLAEAYSEGLYKMEGICRKEGGTRKSSKKMKVHWRKVSSSDSGFSLGFVIDSLG